MRFYGNQYPGKRRRRDSGDQSPYFNSLTKRSLIDPGTTTESTPSWKTLVHDDCARRAPTSRFWLAQWLFDGNHTRGLSRLVRAGKRLNFSRALTDTKSVRVPENSASNCHRPEWVVGSKP